MGISNRIKLIHGIIVLLLVHYSYRVEANECSPGRFFVDGLCIPPTTSICPSNSIYSNKVCRYRSDYLCSRGTFYTNGVCAKAPATIACSQTPKKCAQPMLCPSSNTEMCPYRQMCPQNSLLYNGKCVTKSIAQCPTGSVPQSGYCVRPSICPINSYMRQGGCVEVPKAPAGFSCPFGSHRNEHMCVQDSNTACPTGSNFANGVCSREEKCPENSFIYNSVCAQCRVNSEYVNNECIQCRPDMLLKDGRCSCEQGKSLLNGDCVHINPVSCGENRILNNGKCEHRYCYGPRCCADSLCNSCFDSCQQLNTNSSSLSVCQGNCMQNIAPTIEPVRTPVQILQLGQPQIQVISPPPSSPIQYPPTDYSNIMNITNIVNNSNIHNIVTTANYSNINHIKLGEDSQSTQTNANNNSTLYSIENEENCCVITEPRKCVERDGKHHCSHRRRHSCGEECLKKEEPAFVQTIVEPHISIPPPQITVQQPPPQQPPQTIAQQLPQLKVQQPPQIIVKQPPPTQQIYVQQPQIVQQPYVVQQQQLQYVQQQQPQYVQQQQPQYVQQSAVPQQISVCTYQNTWPFINCIQQQNIDCRNCDLQICGSHCYGQLNIMG